MDIASLLEYGTIASVVGINSLGVGIGEGWASAASLDAIHRQPKAKDDIAKIAILGTALIETAAILGIAIATMLLFDTRVPVDPLYAGIARVGIAFAICLSGFIIGIASALPTRGACYATARQPFFATEIMRFMLITQSIIQTPLIFAFIIAMFIKSQALFVDNFNDSLRLLSSGLAIGLGSMGPALGLALYAQTACKSLGINRHAYNQLFSFSLISQAIIETPIIFALSVGILLVIQGASPTSELAGITYLASALSIGLGTIGPGISSGMTAAAACRQIALKPETYSTLSKISMLGQGLIDTCAIYALLISLLLIFFL